MAMQSSQATWSRHAHSVQFYETEEFLCEHVADFLYAGLVAGEGAVVIATEPHRKMLIDRLTARGIDVTTECREGHLELLDARDILRMFMVRDRPDAERFESVLGPFIEHARDNCRSRRVRAYGEMVDVLLQLGNIEAAKQLEALWTELGNQHGFELLCAYSMKGFYHDRGTSEFAEICEHHEFVGPLEPIAQSRGAQFEQVQALASEIKRRQATDSQLRETIAELHQAKAETETMFRIAQSLNASKLDLETVLQRLTDEATTLVGAQLGAFFYNVTDANGDSYSLYTLSGVPRDTFSKFGLPRKTPIFSPTFSGQGVVRSDDITADPRYGKLGPHFGMPNGHPPVKSYLAVSVFARDGGVLGGLFFGHSQPARFTPDHERMVQSLSAHASIAIENARLFGEARVAEAAQRRVVEDLTETVRLNELFTGVLAHDLRNPLAAITTAAQVLLARGNIAESKTVQRIVSSGERMARMIDQLLDFTRIRVGPGLPFDPKPADLESLVCYVGEELSAAAIHVERTGDPKGTWDPDRLSQAFSNLIGNALQHGEPGGAIEIAIDGTDQTQVLVSVHNAGRIPDELIPNLFAPMTSGRKESSRGLGLGLFITYEIAKLHGGTITAASDEAGTTFVMTLPRAAVAVPAQPPKITDATQFIERRRVQADRENTDSRLRMLIDNIRDYAIFMLDAQGHVQSWNPGAQLAKGYTASEILGKHIELFYTPDDRAAGKPRRLLEQAATHGRVEDEGWRVRKDGTRFWANVVITALRDPSGKRYGFAKVTRDLTDRHRLESERRHLARAQEELRERDEFLSIVAHELRTPLTSLQLQLHGLLERVGDADPKLHEKVARSIKSGDRLAQLIESLLDTSRIATGRFALRLEHFDFTEAVRETLDSFQEVATKTGCSLLTKLESPLVGSWDRRGIRQVVGHLLSNAIKYGSGAAVEVSVARDADDVVLVVRDHGPGIAANDVERVFERFERAVSARNYGGFGLGLYVIREITEAHGGSVIVNTATGGGACFTLRIPLGN